jgi:hypothetical protein
MARPKKAQRRPATQPKSARRTALDQVMDLFREWGRQGGRERAKRLSPETRRRIARKAVQARWKAEKGRQAQG